MGKWGKDRDEYGVRETTAILEMLHKRREKLPKQGESWHHDSVYLAIVSSLEEMAKVAQKHKEKFQMWFLKWHADRDKYRRDIWKEFEDDVQTWKGKNSNKEGIVGRMN